MDLLLEKIKSCRICNDNLPLKANPIFSIDDDSKIAVISQAPGRMAHLSGIPFQDPSGKNLRNWLGVNEEEFYNAENFAIVPMGFCYPGKGKGGDLPPRPECALTWHANVFEALPNLRLKLLVGQYAQKQYLGKNRKSNLTETVRHFKDYLPEFFPLPHPSPRNGIWMRKNPWFEAEVLPALSESAHEILRLP